MTARVDDPSSRGSSESRLSRRLLIVALLMLAWMTLFEVVKQAIHPDITIWGSHILTIVFSTICATVASYFVLRRYVAVNRALAAKNAEGKRLRRELESTVDQLKVTLSEVKTLTGLLPICASCKNIRDDKGHWKQIEPYIRDRSNADFSHGICPECERKLYSEHAG